MDSLDLERSEDMQGTCPTYTSILSFNDQCKTTSTGLYRENDVHVPAVLCSELTVLLGLDLVID